MCGTVVCGREDSDVQVDGMHRLVSWSILQLPCCSLPFSITSLRPAQSATVMYNLTSPKLQCLHISSPSLSLGIQSEEIHTLLMFSGM